MREIKRVFLIVLDSVGIGELPDAASYGDAGSNTMRAIAKSHSFDVPNLQKLGLFNIDGVDCWPADKAPAGSFARLAERSAGKDTTTGHWEIAGLVSEQPLPTYPDGFPPEIVAELERVTGRKMIVNKPYSGTQIIADYGEQHMKTGDLILYTSADSVLQLAAHEEIIPPEQLYAYCKMARAIMQGPHGVGRIIARPFVGEPDAFTRTANRHDYSLEPPGETLLDLLSAAGLDTIGVGKIHDIFAGRGVGKSLLTRGNADGVNKTLLQMQEDFRGLCFVNLVDFDMLYGHRNNVDGYAGALTEFDGRLEELLNALRDDDVMIITADHGCDPSTPSTDHSREYVPLLVCGAAVRRGVNLGTRASFADIAASIQTMFGLPVRTQGASFAETIIL